MDELQEEFENFKISALTKCKAVNNHIHNVTLGPESCNLEYLTNNSTIIKNREKKTVNFAIKSPNLNKDQTTLGKILTELEAQIKDEISISIRNRIKKIYNATKELENRTKSNWLDRQKMLIAQTHEQEELMLKVLAEHDRQAFNQLQQLEIQQQKQAEERHRRNLELQKREKQKREVIHIFESIHKQQVEFRVLYQEILTLLKENNIQNMRTIDSKKYAAISAESVKLKFYIDAMEKLKEACKAQTVELTTKNLSSNDLSQFILTAKANLKISTDFVNDTKKLKEKLQFLFVFWREEENKSNFTEEVPPVVQEQEKPRDPRKSQNISDSKHISVPESSTSSQKENLINKPEFTPPLTTVETFGNKTALKEYENLQNFLNSYKKNLEILIQDSKLKRFRFYCQKAVNIPLNAISAVSSQHLLDKYNRLSNLLRGNPVEAGGTTVVSSQHPLGIAFCTDLLAKKFVLQGDLLISSNPESAHCYAAVLVALWHDFPDFGKLVLAYFHQSVPYLIPFYPPKISGQSDQDYYITLGYNYIDGVVEKQDKFLKRMSGIMRLYAAVTVSKLKRGQIGPHPHGLIYAWKWMASVLNMEPRSDITAALLYEFIEVTGSSMQAAYRQQYEKLLKFINDIYLEKIQKIDSGGPATRLEVLLQKISKIPQIEAPKGRLSENFW